MSRIALVTGASRGIGRATAISLAKGGWIVIVAGRDKAALEIVASEAGNGALAIVCDVSDPASVEELFKEVERKYYRLDLLFNNAGISSRDVPIEKLGVDEWRNVVDTNISGVFYCTQQAFRMMKTQNPQGGRIINNGSISAHVPRPNSAPYTATKHAVTGLTKSASLDGREFNIACGQIDVGNADTNMTSAQRAGSLQPNGTKMVEPTIDPQVVADAVLYMSGLPLDANVQFMTVLATKMPYIGRG